MKQLTLSNGNGFLMNIDVSAQKRWTNSAETYFVPMMHVSGEAPTTVPEKLEYMDYRKRWKCIGAVPCFRTELEAVEFAEKQVRKYYQF